jgi:hypothetical protein
LTTTSNAQFWIALCWDRIPAGPEPGGPPWLFVTPQHAEAYAAQLRGQGIPSQVRGWDARVTEWKGGTLVRHPVIPPPQMAAAPASQAQLSSPPSEPSAHAETHNGTPVSSAPAADVQPPPSLE